MSLRRLRYAKFAVFAPLPVFALVWFAKTGSISILDLLGVDVEGNAFSADPVTEIFCWLIQNPGSIAFHANVSHLSISLGRRSISMKKSCLAFRSL